MRKYEYKVSAQFADGDKARQALEMVKTEFSEGVEAFIMAPGDEHVDRKLEPESGAVKREILSGIFKGTAFGLAAGLVAAVILGLAGVSFVEASPFLSFGWIIAYAGAIGSIFGGIHGMRISDSTHVAAVKDELGSDRHVVMVHAEDRTLASRVESLLNEQAQLTSRS
jgi:hypothetical protein